MATLYIPSSLKNVRLHSRIVNKKNDIIGFNKILVKQSYIILVWLHYLSRSSHITNKEIKDFTNKIPSFFVYPSRRTTFTLIKSPMAHKTFSQEQFFYKSFRLSISFESEPLPFSVNKVCVSLYFLNFILNNIPYVSTNMFLIQRYTLIYYSCDISFFNFHNNLFRFRLTS